MAKRRSRGAAARAGSSPESALRRTPARPHAPSAAAAAQGETPVSRATARAWWTTVLLIAVTALAVYANSLRGELLFDDVNAVVANPWVRTADVRGILTQASWWSEARGHGWRPVTTLTFAADHAVHGVAPLGYHVVNVVLHAATSVLVFAVFARVAAPLPAAIAGLLFAAHPVHTEAVASVVGRAELLAAGGFFVAWLLFLRADAGARGGRRALHGALGVAAFLVALLAKENAAALVLVLPFADVLCAPPGGRAAALRRRAGRYAALVAAAILFVMLRQLVFARGGGAYGLNVPGSDAGGISMLDNPLVALPPVQSELTAIKVAGLYAWRLLVPWQLAADYSYQQISPVASPLDPAFLAALVAVAAVPLLGWWTWRRAPAAALGLGFLALTFAMVSNLVFAIGTIMAERLIYLPSAGFCLALAALLERATRPPTSRATTRGAAPSTAHAVIARGDAPSGAGAAVPLESLWTARLAVPLAVVLALYGARTWSRNAVWRDRVTFFSTMVAEAPQSARSHRELGSVLADSGKYALARAEFERSLAIKPNDVATIYNLGNALLQERRVDDAIAAYKRALALKPNFADAMVNLGNAESLRGDHETALESMRRALALTPRSTSLHMNVANELFRLGRHAEARAEYQAALTINPDATDVLTNYGAFLYSLGEYDAAANAYRRAGDVPMALVGLTATHRAQGKIAEARATQARAAQLFPSSAAVRQMGDVLERDTAAAAPPGG